MKRRNFLKGLSLLPAILGLTPTLTLANGSASDDVITPLTTGLEIIINIIHNDKRLNKRVSEEDISDAIDSVKRMNEILIEAILKTGVANDKSISIADTRELNDYIFNNHHEEWVLLHGNDEEDNETGFHKVVNNGSKTKLYGNNAINKIFDTIYHLGFETHLKNRLLNEDGDKNGSYKKIAVWLDTLLKDDLEAGTLINSNIKEVVGETGTGLDQVVSIIYSDERLQKKISIGDMRIGAYSANEMNKLIIKSIKATNAGASGSFTVQNIKDMNSFLVNNYADRWRELHGNDEEDEETGFHKVQKDGAKIGLFNKNAINGVFDGIYHLGFATQNSRRLVNEDGDDNVSFKKIALWLTNLMKDDLDNNSEDLKMLIPLYSYPTDNSNSEWNRLIDIRRKYKDAEIVAIINPTNGHFREKESDYSTGIKRLVDADIKVLGYVYTDYGDRASQDVIDDMEAWKNIYKEDGISGIFFDETSIDSSKLSYYENLSSEAKNRGLNFTVINPGMTTDQSYIDSNLANIIVTCEYTNELLLDKPPSDYNEPTETTELSILIYRMEDSTIDDLISFAREHQFGYIYFTEDGFDDNPWDNLTENLDEEISKMLV